VDDGSTPVATPSTPIADTPSHPRSLSTGSAIVPTTPATTQPSSPTAFRGAGAGGKTWDLASEVTFYDGKAKSPPTKVKSLPFRATTSTKQTTHSPAPTQPAQPAQPAQTGQSSASTQNRVPPPSRPRALLPQTIQTEDETFSVDRIPSKRKMWEAGTCFLRDEDGQLVCFGDLFPRWEEGHEGGNLRTNATPNSHSGKDKDKEKKKEKDEEKTDSIVSRKSPKTVVFFIRHFWCGQCQDYTFASVSLLEPVALAAAGIKVVIISNGSWKIIKSYKKLFNCPFPIYVDGPRKLYHLLG